MSVKIGNKSYETLKDDIFVGGSKIVKIYAGEVLIYPIQSSPGSGSDPGSETEFDVVPKYRIIFYSSDPFKSTLDMHNYVNSYGGYLYVGLDDSIVYRVAFKIYQDEENHLWYVKSFISANGFGSMEIVPKYVLYTAMENLMITDGLKTPELIERNLVEGTNIGRTYYYTILPIGTNIRDIFGNIADVADVGTGADNAKIFDTDSQCINYVTGLLVCFFKAPLRRNYWDHQYLDLNGLELIGEYNDGERVDMTDHFTLDVVGLYESPTYVTHTTVDEPLDIHGRPGNREKDIIHPVIQCNSDGVLTQETFSFSINVFPREIYSWQSMVKQNTDPGELFDELRSITSLPIAVKFEYFVIDLHAIPWYSDVPCAMSLYESSFSSRKVLYIHVLNSAPVFMHLHTRTRDDDNPYYGNIYLYDSNMNYMKIGSRLYTIDTAIQEGFGTETISPDHHYRGNLLPYVVPMGLSQTRKWYNFGLSRSQRLCEEYGENDFSFLGG